MPRTASPAPAAPDFARLANGTHALYRQGRDGYAIKPDGSNTWRGRLAVWLCNVSLFKKTDFVRHNIPVIAPGEVLKALKALSKDPVADFGGQLDGLASTYCDLTARKVTIAPGVSVTYRNIKALAQFEALTAEAVYTRLNDRFVGGRPQQWQAAAKGLGTCLKEMFSDGDKLTRLASDLQTPGQDAPRVLALKTAVEWMKTRNQEMALAEFDKVWPETRSVAGPDRSATRKELARKAMQEAPLSPDAIQALVRDAVEQQRVEWLRTQLGDGAQAYTPREIAANLIGTKAQWEDLTHPALRDRELRAIPMLVYLHAAQTATLGTFVPPPGRGSPPLDSALLREAADALATLVLAPRDADVDAPPAMRFNAATQRFLQVMKDHLPVAYEALRHLATKELTDSQRSAIVDGLCAEITKAGVGNQDRIASIKAWVDRQLSAAQPPVEDGAAATLLDALTAPVAEALFGRDDKAHWRQSLGKAIAHGYHKATLEAAAGSLVSRINTQFQQAAQANDRSVDALRSEYERQLDWEFEAAGMLDKLPGLKPGALRELVSTGSTALATLRALGADPSPEQRQAANGALAQLAATLRGAARNAQGWSLQVPSLLAVLVPRAVGYDRKREPAELQAIAEGLRALVPSGNAMRRAAQKVSSLVKGEPSPGEVLAKAMASAVEALQQPVAVAAAAS